MQSTVNFTVCLLLSKNFIFNAEKDLSAAIANIFRMVSVFKLSSSHFIKLFFYDNFHYFQSLHSKTTTGFLDLDS